MKDLFSKEISKHSDKINFITLDDLWLLSNKDFFTTNLIVSKKIFFLIKVSSKLNSINTITLLIKNIYGR